MKKAVIPAVIIVLTILWSFGPKSSKYEIGEIYNGFKLVEKKFVNEVNAECFYFTHEKSGARLFKVAADDPNKLFDISFKTVPENDFGTPHIMEHSVLNGSKNFPVKSPFDILNKGSLNTFLNAMTGSEITTYPVASMNDKDYYNLMHVYLDAVFNPLIYDDPRILQQEGWHREMEESEGDIVYKGVVYNEMKGAFSSPTRELDYQMKKILFPDNTYGVSSGGYPTLIPKLTYEDFINFHKKFYHPSNSYILLYGDADLDRELAFINEKYLANYEKSDKAIEIPLQKPFEEMKVAEKSYAVPEGSDIMDKTYLNLSFVVGKSTDVDLSLAFTVIQDALVNHESAPVRLALQKAGIGKDVIGYFSESKQNVFEIQVQNANPEDQQRFKEVVFSSMKKAVEEGFDKESLEGIINRKEFILREGDTPQKGLQYLFMNYQGWFFADDPYLGLEYEKPLKKVKESLSNRMLEEIVDKYLLNNPHSLLLSLKPQPGLQAEIDKKVSDELKTYKDGLSEDEKLTLVKQTKDLIAYQKEEDTQEDLETIPMLLLSDISPEVKWYEVSEKKEESVPVIHLDEFTNNIIYTNIYFDLSVLPQELIPYAKLHTALLGKLNTENYTYGELNNQLNIHTGSFSTMLGSYLEDNNDEKMQPKLWVSTKATMDKTVKMFELTSEILNNSKFEDTLRLKTLLTRHQSRVEDNIKNNGIGVAVNRLASYYTNFGMFKELTNGLEYYNFITDIINNFDENHEEIINNLNKTAQLLFNLNNMTAAVTCSDENYRSYVTGLKVLNKDLRDDKVTKENWSFKFEQKNEGLQTSSKVQYVIKGYDYKKLGYQWNGKIRVLNQILSSDWLQTQVRVIGGAYGGFSNFSSDGKVYFGSYRDPNLKETIANYDATPEFLRDFKADDREMTRFIIGTISRLDRPKTASQKGETAYSNYFRKTKLEDLKAERTAILSTTEQDIKDMEKMVADILAKNVICVYGNDKKIEENKALFKSVVKIIK